MKKIFKIGCGGFLALILLGVIIGMLSDGETNEDATTEPKQGETDTKVESSAEPKAEVKEDTAKENENKDAEIYKQEIVIHLDAFQDEYDKHWENNWVTTFEGVGNGTIDAYTAYSTLNSLEKYYTGLGNKTRNTELPKLSKENQKLLDAYLKDFRSAILTRSRAAKEAAQMFDLGEFKPSEMEKIKSTVNYADQELLSALTERVKLEQKLGITE